MIDVIRVPAFTDNYIWLIRARDKPYCAIVDPGDAAPVLAVLQAQQLQPLAILITHHHRDHVGGIAALRERYADLTVYGPANEDIPARDVALREGQGVTLPELDVQFEVIDVPGHTRGHIAYYGHGMLFCGDTLFMGGCGKLFEGTPEQMHHSLSKLAALPDDTLVYCAHEYTLENLLFAIKVEPHSRALQHRIVQTQTAVDNDQATVPARLGTEKATNPFLRSQISQVARAAQDWSGQKLTTPAEVFATVRAWKDWHDSQ